MCRSARQCQTITDEDPLNPLILAGTLLGAFGWVGLTFTFFFPETPDDTPREFAPAWNQAMVVVKRRQAPADGEAAPADPTPTADAAAAKVAEMQGDPGQAENPMTGVNRN